MALPSIGGEIDFMAPTFDILVEGQPLDSNVLEFIESIEYESADGIADVARIRAVNPDFILSNAKVFQPGNEITIWMGYGSEQEFIGRGIIRKQVPNFPQSGMPTIQAVAYTKDVIMMDNEPEKPKKKKGKGGRVFKDSKFSSAVENRASDYGFEQDIDDTPDEPSNFIQRPGQSDYEFVNGLANLNGYVFWVDGDDEGKWTLHFKNPDSLSKLQEKQYTFIYNQQDDSTLLTFQPEFLINGAYTEIEVIVKDARTGQLFTTTVKEENGASPDISAIGDPTGEIASPSPIDILRSGSVEGLTTASDVKLYFNDFSFNVNTDRRFKSQAEVEAWAKQWFRRMRENFILSRGRVIGVGNLRARQVHKLRGVGDLYSGDYYFTKVKHVCSKSQGYVIDFAARKVVP
jgi:phage protein D